MGLPTTANSYDQESSVLPAEDFTIEELGIKFCDDKGYSGSYNANRNEMYRFDRVSGLQDSVLFVAEASKLEGSRSQISVEVKYSRHLCFS